MEKHWVEDIQIACQKNGVAFFFKQWGGVQKSKAGRLLNGKTHDAMPERVVSQMPSKSQRLMAVQRVRDQMTSLKGSMPNDLGLVRL